MIVTIVTIIPLPEGRRGGGRDPSPFHFLIRRRVTMNIRLALLQKWRTVTILILMPLPVGKDNGEHAIYPSLLEMWRIVTIAVLIPLPEGRKEGS